MAQLYVLSGPDVGKSFDVEPGDTIGRSPDCIVTLRHASVSRKHARLEREGGAWFVVDDGSRNGVTVDGARTKRAALTDMGEFSLGELLLRFREESPASEAPPTPPPEPAPTPAPAPEPERDDEGDDMVIEDPDEIEIERPSPSKLLGTTLARRPVAVGRTQDAGFGAAQGPAGSELARGPVGAGDRILQYGDVRGGGTFSTSELSQYPLWVRTGVVLVGIALAAGLAWMAYHGTSFVKQQFGDGEAAQEE